MFVQQHPVEALALLTFFLLFAFPIHEFAHAFAAYRLGDSTAKLFGKLTLDPIAHFDRIGGTMLVISVLVAGFPFGYAQTPVNPRNLRGQYGDVIVSLAGPLSNLLMAAAVAIPLRLLFPLTAGDQTIYVTEPELVLKLIVQYSILLGLFNLIPVPPLDGGAILLSLLPPRIAWQVRPFLAQYGLFILILLIFPIAGESIVAKLLNPIVDVVYDVLVG